MIEIRIVDKEVLYPAFGLAKDGIVYVRKDLPDKVRSFVIEHELYHLQDTSVNWIWREVKANCYAGLKFPVGLLYTIFLSLSPTRLRFYVKRFEGVK